MTGDCSHCGALWNVTPLYAPRPECQVCQSSICPKCEQVYCFACGIPMHEDCGIQVGEDYYCRQHEQAAMRRLLVEELSDEEVLVLSIALADHRARQRRAAA